ncbi:MAG TPA: hypothetical protein VF198_00125 [Vicinamibacterales bacterium]
MEVTSVRARLGSVLEWVVAAAFLAASILVATLIVRELRTAPRAAAVPEAPVSALPAGVPTKAISVPVLLLLDGKEVRVGDGVDQVARTLGRSAEVGRQLADRGALGERLTRFYEYNGTRFVLVFEPFERNGELRVAGIYLQ